jgi:septal ring factor EnvC (AmiA/AmiB activator)
VLEERALRITELEGELAAASERLAAAEAAAESERAAFEEKSTRMKTMLQVCGPAEALVCGRRTLAYGTGEILLCLIGATMSGVVQFRFM